MGASFSTPSPSELTIKEAQQEQDGRDVVGGASDDGFRPLAKAKTFGHKKAPAPGAATTFGELSGFRRAWSDVVDPKFLRKTGHGYHLGHERFMNDAADEVLYRRHFNFTPVKRVPSLKGVTGFMELTRRQTGEALEPSTETPDTVVVVDPFSTGVIVAAEALNQGFQLVYIFSGELEELADMVPDEYRDVLKDITTLKVDEAKELEPQLPDLVASLLAATEGSKVRAILAGAETGVELADALSEAMKLPTSNGTQLSAARRNKYLMGEQVRAAGLRAVEQAYASTWAEVASFLERFVQQRPIENGVVVKPMNSAGSDDVFLCHSEDEVKEAYGCIMGKRNQLGLVNDGVLVQEYLTGIEYVVDSVTLDGEHKCVAIWEYDRRPANGGSFVNFGQKLLAGDVPNPCDPSPNAPSLGEVLVDYTHGVLDALGIRYGPTHAEVKVSPSGPCLVEVGARCHGGEGLWVPIADQVWGYDQAKLTMDVYAKNTSTWAEVPRMPQEKLRRKHGILKFLISFQSGVLKRFNPAAVDKIKALPSYVDIEFFRKPGDVIMPTINCFGWTGAVKLVAPSEEELEADNAFINELEKSGELYLLQDASIPSPEPSLPGDNSCVIIVDPFSTGAVVAQNVCHAGFDCVCVYSGKLSDMAFLESFIPAGLEISFASVIAQPEEATTVQAMCENTLGELDRQNTRGKVVAVLPGTETAVELADALSEALHLKTNGTSLSLARRNKYLMGETIRQAGLRAVAQVKATDWSEVEAFLEENGLLEPRREDSQGKVWWPLVNKPLDSAGTDNVTLNRSVDELKKSFGEVAGHVNGLGRKNEGCLIQEYLEGDEYVVDSCSFDGEHKTVCVWRYDRGPLNGSPFVCQGQEILVANEVQSMGRDLIPWICEYTHGVLDALQVRYGPSHAEVKICRGEPVLVEVGARCHGAEGVWIELAQRCLGYDQAALALDSMHEGAALQAIPSVPGGRQAYGRAKFLCVHDAQVGNMEKPTLVGFGEEAMKEIRSMPSYVGFEPFKKPGNPLWATTDCFTWAGVVKLCHESLEQLQQDYDRVRSLEKEGLFVVREAEA